MCIRDYYLSRIKSIDPLDAAEADELRRAEQWINDGGTIFRPPGLMNHDDQHFVTYFPLVDFISHSVFLVHHKKASIWLPPGGHIEEGETPTEATIRECGEELGIPARFVSPKPIFLSSVVTQNTEDPHHDIAFWFLLSASRDDVIEPDSREFSDSAWFDIQGPLPTPVEPNMPRFIEKVRKQRFGLVGATGFDPSRSDSTPEAVA